MERAPRYNVNFLKIKMQNGIYIYYQLCVGIEEKNDMHLLVSA